MEFLYEMKMTATAQVEKESDGNVCIPRFPWPNNQRHNLYSPKEPDSV